MILSCTGATEIDLDSNSVIAESLGWILATCHGSRNHRAALDNDRDILNTMTKLLRDYPVDAQRIYICGFSGMGSQSLDELIARPGLFRGAISSCAPFGGGPNGIDLSGHAVSLITREEDWNREGNQRWKTYFDGAGAAVRLVVTEGKHEPGGPEELLDACRWIQANSE